MRFEDRRSLAAVLTYICSSGINYYILSEPLSPLKSGLNHVILEV